MYIFVALGSVDENWVLQDISCLLLFLDSSILFGATSVILPEIFRFVKLVDCDSVSSYLPQLFLHGKLSFVLSVCYVLVFWVCVASSTI